MLLSMPSAGASVGLHQHCNRQTRMGAPDLCWPCSFCRVAPAGNLAARTGECLLAIPLKHPCCGTVTDRGTFRCSTAAPAIPVLDWLKATIGGDRGYYRGNSLLLSTWHWTVFQCTFNPGSQVSLTSGQHVLRKRHQQLASFARALACCKPKPPRSPLPIPLFVGTLGTWRSPSYGSYSNCNGAARANICGACTALIADATADASRPDGPIRAA